MDTILTFEASARLISFLGLYACFSALEAIYPRRKKLYLRKDRWFTNLTMVVIDTIVVRLLLFILPVGFAGYAYSNGWGFLAYLKLPYVFEIILTVLVLDFVIYWQHYFFHKIAFFWRFHKVHHTDLDFDVSTGVRFHPIEILFSLAIKLTAIFLLGAPILGVVLFEIILNGTSLFNHTNLNLPKWLDTIIRSLIVTPDMHRVHHSTIPAETDSNFGFNLSVWDKIFKTYRPQPKLGHIDMNIGLKQYPEIKELGLKDLLVLPIKKR